ncbi:MAG TPA: hypothetical protein DEO96_06935, partial [Alteromonas sp.]|nr:hypothetical protein [Alteromonas sp.]
EEQLRSYLVEVNGYIQQTTTLNEAVEPITQETLQQRKDQIKDALILAGTLHHIEIAQMSVAVDCLHEAWHIAK